MADEKQQIVNDDAVEGVDGHEKALWGKAFRWEIRGASVEEVWRIAGDFVRVDAWMTSIVQSCELVAGQVNQAGCVRKPTLYPSAPGQPPATSLEKLLLIDPPSHILQYTILQYAILPGSILPVFSLMDGYVGTLRLTSPSPAPDHHDDHHHPTEHRQPDHHHDAAVDAEYQDACARPPSTCVLHWSFTCKPSAALTQEQAIHTAFSLYNIAINDLKAHLSLPDDSVTLLE